MNDMGTETNLQSQKERLLAKIQLHTPINERMKQAFLSVPREHFVLPKYKDQAYVDTPLPILSGQTISAIHMVLIYISPLCTNPQIGERVLEIGAGSGYNAAMFAEMVAPKNVPNKGHVYATEIISELSEFAKKNIEQTGYSDRVSVITSDGGLGYPDQAPYDIISVACSAKSIPEPLIDQLAPNGRLIIPVGRQFYQDLFLIKKDEHGKITKKNLMGVAFVPLTGKFG